MQYELATDLDTTKYAYFVQGFLSEAQQLNPGDLSLQTLADKPLLKIYCGSKEKFNLTQLKKRLADIFELLNKQNISSALITMPQLANKTPNQQLQLMIRCIEEKTYQMLDFKTPPHPSFALKRLVFHLEGSTIEGLQTAQAIAKGMNLTRTLANLPANICTPTYLGEAAIQLAKAHPKVLKTRVWDKEAIEKFKMGALLAVAQGSHEEPRFIEIHYQPQDTKQAHQPPVVLVGKGVTFDAGGISLKPSANMNEMKYDMAGAASVIGALKACAELELPIPVIGLIAATENMPGGRAVKPGDVIQSMSGKTIEILNTDAEGRLILADALTYAERFQPRFVVDIATLTGAIIIALGHVNSGLMTTDDELAETLLKAAKHSDDKLWRLPLEDDYQEAMNSPLADMVNAQFDRGAGSITAACFLSRFTQNLRWAHLDIAGTAWISGTQRQATGRPVALLMQWLQDVSETR